MKRFLFLSLFLCLSVLQIAAQDAIAVSKEPLHKNVFENKYVRVLDLHIAPGDTTLLHKHETPCVSISLHPVRTGAQTLVDDKSPRVPSLDRRITFDGFYQSPRIHRVWNRDTSTFHGMDVEILTKGDRKMEAPIAIDGFTQVFDAPPLRAYRFTLKGNQQIKLERNAPILIVGLNNGSEVLVNKQRFTKQGDFLFVKPSRKIQLANNSGQDYSFAVLEMK
jgi:hypothetical protein